MSDSIRIVVTAVLTLDREMMEAELLGDDTPLDYIAREVEAAFQHTFGLAARRIIVTALDIDAPRPAAAH